jgi:hypothetical protein
MPGIMSEGSDSVAGSRYGARRGNRCERGDDVDRRRSPSGFPIRRGTTGGKPNAGFGVQLLPRVGVG